MDIQEIHDMTADALAGEELQFRNNDAWHAYNPTSEPAFYHNFQWRIKPTIEVNSIMMSKRQAKAAWELSRATYYEYTNLSLRWCKPSELTFDPKPKGRYRWQEAKWIYVNGEKIARSGGALMYRGYAIDSAEDVEKFKAALHKLIEIK